MKDDKTMFCKADIQTFELKDLIGRTLHVTKREGENCEIISAYDLRTKEIFVLAQNKSFKSDQTRTMNETDYDHG